jgi:hypothetical protein
VIFGLSSIPWMYVCVYISLSIHWLLSTLAVSTVWLLWTERNKHGYTCISPVYWFTLLWICA